MTISQNCWININSLWESNENIQRIIPQMKVPTTFYDLYPFLICLFNSTIAFLKLMRYSCFSEFSPSYSPIFPTP